MGSVIKKRRKRMAGRAITLGGGAHGVAVLLDADSAVPALGAILADVTEPEPTTPNG